MGSGYRVFTAGEVLTASNVQNYLQDQAVMVFGGTAARSSAIGTANFEEGMLTYLTDVDKLQVYTGAAFADVYPAAATNQGLTLISTTSFSGVASQSVNSVFSSTYTNYRLIFNITDASVDDFALSIKFRASGTDTSANYLSQRFFAFQTTVGTDLNPVGTDELWLTLGDKDFDYTAISADVYNPNVALPTSLTAISVGNNGTNHYILLASGVNTGVTQFDGFTLITNGGTITGSVSVYGYNK